MLLLGLTVLISTATVRAADAVKDPKAIVASHVASSESFFSGDAGFSVTNLYNSRGYALVTKGANFQPYADFNFNVYQGDGFITSVTPTLGLWSNLTTNSNGTASATTDFENWYEFDWMPGISVVMAKRFNLSVAYFEFDSPSGGFKTARSINTTLAYDDAGLLDRSKNFSVQPCLTFLAELPAPGSAGALKNGEYLEPGINPNYTFFQGSSYPLTVAVPIKLGFGNHFYTEGISFGYFSPGLAFSVPLAFMPSDCGSWTGSVGFKYFKTGDRVNAPEFRDQEIFNLSIGCKF